MRCSVRPCGLGAQGLNSLLDRISSNLRQVEGIEERIRGMRDSHFSYAPRPLDVFEAKERVLWL